MEVYWGWRIKNKRNVKSFRSHNLNKDECVNGNLQINYQQNKNSLKNTTKLVFTHNFNFVDI